MYDSTRLLARYTPDKNFKMDLHSPRTNIFRRTVTTFQQRTNGLHWSILAIYFLNAFLQAFPMTAVGNWLQFDLEMSPSQQSSFYASIFIPFTLKPLYGWISERFPIRGYRRRPYVISCSIIIACTWFVIAWMVTTPSAAFGIMTLLSTANAFSDLMLGLLVVDLACKDMSRAGALQSASESVQSGASLLALLVGLPLYPCNGATSPLDPKLVFIITGAIAVLQIFVTLFLPDTFVGVPPSVSAMAPMDDIQTPLLPIPERLESNDLKPRDVSNRLFRALRPPHASREFPAMELAIPGVLLLMVWASVKSFMVHESWMYFLYAVLLVDTVLLLMLLRHAHIREVTFTGVMGSLWVVWPAIILFLTNAVPSASDTIYSFQYSVWMTHVCYPQYLSIISEATALASGCAFFFLFHNWSGRRIIHLFLASGLIAAASQLLWWPWVDGGVTSAGQPSFGYAVFASIVTEMFMQCFFITSLVVATQACPLDYRSTFAFTFYLSFIDIGDSVSGWVSAPIIDALNITLTNYSHLDVLVWIGTGSFVLALLFSPLLFFAKLPTISHS